MRRTFRRRRNEGKTDYKARLTLLKSSKPRFVVRKTNRYIIAQLVESEKAQDKIISGGSSQILLEKGWPKESKGSLKSLPAAYLIGFIIAKKASDKCKEALLDIGLHRNIKKSRIYAALKGALDAGIKIPHNPDVLPSIENIQKHKMGRFIDQIKEKI